MNVASGALRVFAGAIKLFARFGDTSVGRNLAAIGAFIERRAFAIISFFFFLSYWFFAFFVRLNDGVFWGRTLSIPHHPFRLSMFDQDFWGTVLYNFSQNPFYSILTWLLIKTDPATEGFVGYMVFHHVLGYYAIFCLYRILGLLRVNKLLVVIALSLFVFNPGYYFFFSHGWYDYPSMCLVSIVAYHFLAVAKEYSTKNLVVLFTWLTILVAYRGLFHPLFFMIPTIVGVCLIHRKYVGKTLLYAVIPLLIGLFPYAKNYVLFDSFSPALGSFAMAYKSQTFQYVPNEEILPYVQEGKISPLVFCFNAYPGFTYNGEVYSPENCQSKLPKKLLAKEIEQLRRSNDDFGKIGILTDSENMAFDISAIPNSISGVVLGRQMLRDARAYFELVPGQRLASIRNNLSQYFRTNNAYQFIIAVNWHKYPLWFGSPRWNLDFFKINNPEPKWNRYDFTSRPLIVIFILLPLVFSFFYAAGIDRGDKRFYAFYAYVAIVLFTLLLSKMSRVPFQAVCVSLPFAVSLIGVFAYKLISDPRQLGSRRIAVGYMAGVCLYLMLIVSVVVSSEQERYRFATDGLSLILFLFFIDHLITLAQGALCRFKGTPNA